MVSQSFLKEQPGYDPSGYNAYVHIKGARLRKGRPNRCHANAASLWLNNMDDTRICTGYALSKDGMWRQHSWLIHFKEKSNQIIETTTPRIGYYGFVLNTEQCIKFVSKNYY